MASFVRGIRRSPVLLWLVACSFDERDLDERGQDNGGEGGETSASGGVSGKGGSSNAGATAAGKGGAGGNGAVAAVGGAGGASNAGGAAGVGGVGGSGGAGNGGTSGSGGVAGSSAGAADTGDGGLAGEAGSGSSAGGGAGAPGVDPCATNPCANGGTCVPDGDQATCRCEGGFTGATCTRKILSVLSAPGCRAEGVSGDGTVLAGACIEAGIPSPFRWTGEESDQLQALPLTNGATEGGAFGVNANGLVIVGWSGQSGERLAVRWVNGTVSGYQRLSNVENYYNRAHRTDEDGSVAVGVSQRSGEYDTAVRWTTSTAAPTHVESGGPHEYSFARGVSADGAYVVGYGTDEAGAFTWTAETGYQALPGLDGVADNRALGVSDDGEVVVGTSGGVATRWVARVPTSLGSPGEPLSASADGSVIVGRVGAEAFVWTEADGIRTLAAELMALDVDLGDFVPTAATDVSDDGTVIAGYGTLDGADHAFRVTLPSP